MGRIFQCLGERNEWFLSFFFLFLFYCWCCHFANSCAYWHYHFFFITVAGSLSQNAVEIRPLRTGDSVAADFLLIN